MINNLFKNLLAPNGRGVRAAARKQRASKVAGITALESRQMLSSTIVAHWESTSRLTVSFAPDGTDIAGQQSNLYSEFSSAGTVSQWQSAILSAFQTVSASVNVSVGVVGDNGADFGAAGANQGDARFGDIRIGAASLGAGVFAYSIPTGGGMTGTHAGDIVFNSDYVWDSLSDIKSIAEHEFGHVLGLGPSTSPSSMMYQAFTPGTTIAPSTADIENLTALLGARNLDKNEDGGENNSLAGAKNLARPDGYSGAAPLMGYGDIHVNSDVDWFKVRAPSGYSGTTVLEVRTAGISPLNGTLNVYNGDGQLLGSGSSVSLSNLTGVAYVRVSSVGSGATSFGTYTVTASFPAAQTATPENIDAVAKLRLVDATQAELQNYMTSGNYRNSEATIEVDGGRTTYKLKTAPGFKDSEGYRVTASLGGATTETQFRIKSPEAGGVLIATVRVSGSSQLVPKIVVKDNSGNFIDATVIRNDAGVVTVQLTGINANDHYRVLVSQDSDFGSQTGQFEFEAQFVGAAVSQTTVATGTLTSANPTASYRMDVPRAGIFQFGLGSANLPGATQGIQLQVFDSTGNEVTSHFALAGDARTSSPVSLGAGSYWVRVRTSEFGGNAIANLDFRVTIATVSDPIGPQPTDPNANPAGPSYNWSGILGGMTPPPGGTMTSTPPTASSSTWDYYYYWMWYWYGGGYMMMTM